MNGVTTKYFIEGDRIALEKAGNEERAFWYDGDGKAAAFVIYDSTGMHPYYYIRNGQGDVIGLFDANGNVVARYSYDSWGNLLSIKDGSGNDKTNDTTFVGYKNPLRYRGYYYDSETKLYYLQSRYYNPEWGRFISADDVDTISFDLSVLTDKNLFAYTDNNPVNRYDPSGYFWKELAENALKAALVCAVVAVVAVAIASTGGGALAAFVGGKILATGVATAAAVTAKAAIATTVGLTAVAAGSAAMEHASQSFRYAKQSKQSGKERATDAPSWAKYQKPRTPTNGVRETSKQFAQRLLNEKYGAGNWNVGTNTEYNKIVKWATRDLGLK